MQTLLILLSSILCFAKLPLAAPFQPSHFECEGTAFAKEKIGYYFCGDERLGPLLLGSKATEGDVSAEATVLDCMLKGYDRLGGMPAGALISNFTSEKRWLYPRDNGFATTNGKLDIYNMTLEAGLYVDRFGPETGSFLSPVSTSYGARAIPPENLNPYPHWPPAKDRFNNYHVYVVKEDFNVTAGRIAPWFGQPGGGRQFWTKRVGIISSLLASGKLERVAANEIPRQC
ncbi:hypothetical protein QQS21_003269 [Conoideocrella luteorostrata]|uniref:TNT domain-containing protein n=1 Tax=Conoideocrella luteorostrata TaxID=1105319 RepID=A0AAJ0CUJ3_9HYPO|nr:hypothetical protein QQS21_003269 [Conoideocrella luteorostrata]